MKIEIIEDDRLLGQALGIFLKKEGYDTQILEFIDMEHTPKNILIRAVKTGKKAENQPEEETVATLSYSSSLKAPETDSFLAFLRTLKDCPCGFLGGVISGRKRVWDNLLCSAVRGFPCALLPGAL